MNRGIITLSLEQHTVLLKLCEQFPETATPELVTRLTAAARVLTGSATPTTAPSGQITNTPIGLELSEDSAEAALDILPLPSDEEPQVITELRTAFLSFLGHLRGY